MKKKNFYIAPSILDANFLEIKKIIKILEKENVDYIHFDVMDGNFVPNLTFGPKFIKLLRPLTKIPFDVHLMIKNPENFIENFLNSGADILTIHLEATKNINLIIQSVKKYKKKVGISIKPKTPIEKIYKYTSKIDLILIMSVEPGFGGQKFMPEVLEKVKKLKKIITKNNYNTLIEIDGGINKETAPISYKEGVDIFVIGSAIFKSKNITKSIREIKNSLISRE